MPSIEKAERSIRAKVLRILLKLALIFHNTNSCDIIPGLIEFYISFFSEGSKSFRPIKIKLYEWFCWKNSYSSNSTVFFDTNLKIEMCLFYRALLNTTEFAE